VLSTVPVGAQSEARAHRPGPRGGPSSRRLLALLLAVAASLLLLAGCGGSGSTPGASGPAALLSTLENWSALETPVDEALGILTQKCMAQHGLRYYPYPQAGQPGGAPFFSAPMFGSSLWLGPQSLAWRIVNGWGLYEQTMQRLSQRGGFAGGVPEEIRVMQSMHGRQIATYMRTLWGGGKTTKIRIPGLGRQTVRIGGCNTTAGEQLFGSVAASVAVPQYGMAILNGTVRPAATRSHALQASVASWATCVHAGTKVVARSPSQLFMHFFALYQTKGPTPAVHRKELKAAVADLQCQRRSRLPQTVRQASLAAVKHLPASVLGELETLVSVLEQARTRARAVFSHPATNAPPVTDTPTTGAQTAQTAQTRQVGPRPARVRTVGGGATFSGPVVVYGG
jgi:hypothetical protein